MAFLTSTSLLVLGALNLYVSLLGSTAWTIFAPFNFIIGVVCLAFGLRTLFAIDLD